MVQFGTINPLTIFQCGFRSRHIRSPCPNECIRSRTRNQRPRIEVGLDNEAIKVELNLQYFFFRSSGPIGRSADSHRSKPNSRDNGITNLAST